MDVRLTPRHGLKQSVDFPMEVTFGPEYGLQVTDAARMELRFGYEDLQPVDVLSTQNRRITLEPGVVAGSVVATVRLTGAASGAYPVSSPAYPLNFGAVPPRLRKAAEDELPDGEDPERLRVFELYGTLLVGARAAVDVALVFEGSFTRG